MSDEHTLVVLRCDECGNVFPLHSADERRCPQCGSEEVHPAGEPLL